MNDETTDPAASQELLTSRYGLRQEHGWRGYRRGRLAAPLFDLRLTFNLGYRALTRAAGRMPTRCVQVASADVPARRNDLEKVLRTLKTTRHIVRSRLPPWQPRQI